MVSDKLFTSADTAWARHGTRFSVVRYGNVMGSRGSVVPLFRKLAREGASLPITDKRMTRFCIPLAQAVRFVVDCFDEMRGGELFVPRIPSMKVTDLVEAIAPGCPNCEVGIRPGEKLHEEMIAREDSHRAFRGKDRYVVVPTVGGEEYVPPEGSRPVPEGFAYRSNTNDLWLSVDELRALLDVDAV
ncbi:MULTISPECIES: polysaccharide biosynthesis protein [unclassified Streptomyces]|uniref:polysaccharide biosynthesis protein n=1 Tax=unclassified Streptomyces TaxID=2593676 RepID=UPI00336AA2D3